MMTLILSTSAYVNFILQKRISGQLSQEDPKDSENQESYLDKFGNMVSRKTGHPTMHSNNALRNPGVKGHESEIVSGCNFSLAGNLSENISQPNLRHVVDTLERKFEAVCGRIEKKIAKFADSDSPPQWFLKYMEAGKPLSSLESQTPHSSHCLSQDNEELISKLIGELIHLRQQLSSQTNELEKFLKTAEPFKQQSLKFVPSEQQTIESLLQRTMTELESTKGELMKLQYQSTLLKNEGSTADQTVEVEHSLTEDMQRVKDLTSGIVKHKDFILSKEPLLIPVQDVTLPSPVAANKEQEEMIEVAEVSSNHVSNSETLSNVVLPVSPIDDRHRSTLVFTAIARNNPQKAVHSVGDSEVVEFDVVVGEKGDEAANCTGPDGEPVNASSYLADKRLGFCRRRGLRGRGRGGAPRPMRRHKWGAADDRGWQPYQEKKGTLIGQNQSLYRPSPPRMDLNKATRSRLNELTNDDFEEIFKDLAMEKFPRLLAMEVDTEERLNALVQVIFDKAVDEPMYAPQYAEVCKLLFEKEVPSASGTGQVSFRKLILDRCQRTFEKGKEEVVSKQRVLQKADTQEKKKELQLVFDERIAKTKRIMLGNIRFIGELFKLRMLTIKIMNFCISKLLKSRDEEQLECLCKLISTIGKTYEEEYDAKYQKAVADAENSGKHLNIQLTKLDVYLDEMRKLSQSEDFSSRIRFMLMDVLDLKQNRWMPRREEEKPKTIDKIRGESQKKRLEKELSFQEEILKQPHMGYSSQRRDGGRDDGRKKSRSGAIDVGGWQHYQTKKRSLIGQDQYSYRPPSPRKDS